MIDATRNALPVARDLSPDEKRALLARLLRDRKGAPSRPAPLDTLAMVEAQASRRPDAPAVVFGGSTLSYGELNARANRLARRLQSIGVRPGSLVGLHLDRSSTMVVAMLGVLKAGAAYLPIDPAYPPDRVAYMIEDAGISALLVDPGQPCPVPPTGAIVEEVDARAIAPELPESNLDLAVHPKRPAYVIYTSGSTGRPKGVVIPHEALGNFLRSFRQLLGIGERDAMLAVTTLSFDIAGLELLLPLTVGARVELAARDEAADGAKLAARIRDGQPTFLQATPATWRLLVESGWAGSPALTMLCGGEALPRELADRLLPLGKALWNLYGPTETTIWSTAWEVQAGAGPILIGKPIARTRCLILDARMNQVPVGVAGELYVSGAGLATGYLGRPGLTADRFLPDPFAEEPGGRMYRTGDLARRHPDGSIECLGRVDHQVKVRGFRVELGEVESAIARHPAIARAIAVAREDASGERALVAYMAAGPGAAPSTHDLRGFLAATLPEYMVPSAFVFVEGFPLTPNGKVDRAALPSPDAEHMAHSREFVPPRNEVEAAVARAFSSALGVDRVGAFDDFFELGGHSLLVGRALARIREALGVEPPLRALFDNPTVAALAEVVASERRLDPAADPAPARYDGPDPAPLSSPQRALWFLDRLDPGRSTFHVSAAIRVDGPLDARALARSFDALIDRHESLRTRFPARDGQPEQVVEPAGPAANVPALSTVDLSGLPVADRDDEARKLAIVEAQKPFELAAEPPARGVLIRLDADRHVVLLTMHHIITDGWSFGIAARDLTALYGEFAGGPPANLPPLPIRPTDHARWQQGRLEAGGPRLARLIDDWTAQLAGLPALELPTDRPRPAARKGRGAVVPFSLRVDLSRRIAEVGRAEGATPFMALLAGFEAVLGRWSGQDDFAVGSPVANRNLAGIEDLVGYFVNMIPLRADLSGRPSFRDVVARVRETSLRAFDRQDLPFDRLVEAIRPARDLSRTPIFQVMFVLQNNETPAANRPDLAVEPFPIDEANGTAKFDLTLALSEVDGAFQGSIEFDIDLFDPSTVERIARSLVAFFEAATLEPGRPIEAIPLIDEADRRLVVDEWNRTDAPVAGVSSVVDLFVAQARERPEAPAIVGERESWTYGEVDRRSDELAARLVAAGVRPGSNVGLCLDRSPAVAEAIWGIFKAGAAFVPLDPNDPDDRLGAVAGTASIRVVVASSRRAEQAARIASVESVQLVGGPIGQSQPDYASIPVAGHPDRAAYVMFTSGSTGEPRGVVVPHRGVINHAEAAARLMGLTPADRVLQSASLGFDIAVEEMFPAWTVGASVVIRERDDDLAPSRFLDLIARREVSVLDLPTAHWHAWTAALTGLGGSIGLPSTLRAVVVGGERALASALDDWREVPGADRVRWINTYGPTEATVIATEFEPPLGATSGELPIGRPIRNARAYILDELMGPVPPGVAGELFVGGVGVARGYLGDPSTTAERFVPDPFAARPGARMFRTGDRARWLADGSIEFLGRKDRQAKIQGFRVEPGEVEAALASLPDLAQAAVEVQQGPAGARLVAYVVVAEGATFDPASLRRDLREILPAPMIPAAFVALDAIPTTATGKVDRRALAAHRAAGPGADRDVPFAPPTTETEIQLAAIWQEVLQVSRVGVRDNFFDLGGHSLLAIRLLARVEQVTGRSLPLSSLFLGASVAEMAEIVDQSAEAGTLDLAGRAADSPLVPIRAAGSKRPFFCVHGAGGIVHGFADLARHLDADRPFWAIQSRGLDDEARPADDMEAMAASYLDAIRAVQPEGPYHLGGWSLGGVVAFEMARQVVASGGAVASLSLFDSHAPRPTSPPSRRGLDSEVGRELASLLAEDDGDADGSGAVDAAILAELAGGLAYQFGQNASRVVKHFRKLPLRDRRELIFRHFQIDREFTEGAGPDRSRRLWNVLRSNLLANARYCPASPFGGKVTLYRASKESPDRAPGGRSMGWNAWIDGQSGSLEAFKVPGDHASILRGPNAARLAARLAERLDGADVRTTPEAPG